MATKFYDQEINDSEEMRRGVFWEIYLIADSKVIALRGKSTLKVLIANH